MFACGQGEHGRRAQASNGRPQAAEAHGRLLRCLSLYIKCITLSANYQPKNKIKKYCLEVVNCLTVCYN